MKIHFPKFDDENDFFVYLAAFTVLWTPFGAILPYLPYVFFPELSNIFILFLTILATIFWLAPAGILIYIMIND